MPALSAVSHADNMEAQNTRRRAVITSLESQIQMLERGSHNPAKGRGQPHSAFGKFSDLSFGIEAIDTRLAGAMHRGGVHAFSAPTADSAALGLALWLAKRHQKAGACGLVKPSGTTGVSGASGPSDPPVCWIQQPKAPAERGVPYAPGLAGLGLDPANLLLIRPRTSTDSLWATEECLANLSGGFIIADLPDMDLKASRRLTLAAQASGATLFCLNTSHTGGHTGSAGNTGGIRGGTAGHCAPLTRWHVESLPSSVVDTGTAVEPLPDTRRIRLSLLKARTAAPKDWLLGYVPIRAATTPSFSPPLSTPSTTPLPAGEEVQHDTTAFSLRLLSAFSVRPVAPAAATVGPGSNHGTGEQRNVNWGGGAQGAGAVSQSTMPARSVG